MLCSFHSVTNFSLAAIALGLPNLQALDLSFCAVGSPDSVALQFIVDDMWPSLHELDVSRNYAVNHQTIERIARAAPNLAYFVSEKSNIGDEAIVALASYCPHLVEITVDRGSPITDMSLVALAECCRELRAIRITLPSTEFSVGQVTKRGIKALARLPYLEELVLECVPGVTLRMLERYIASEDIVIGFNEA